MTQPDEKLWPRPDVSARLVDAIDEAVAEATTPGARAAVSSLLIEEMCAAVDSIHPSAVGPELTGLNQLSVAAADHALEMGVGSDERAATPPDESAGDSTADARLSDTTTWPAARGQ